MHDDRRERISVSAILHYHGLQVLVDWLFQPSWEVLIEISIS
jgi:hypothetical protein